MRHSLIGTIRQGYNGIRFLKRQQTDYSLQARVGDMLPESRFPADAKTSALNIENSDSTTELVKQPQIRLSLDILLTALGVAAALLPVIVAIRLGFFRGSLDDPLAAYGYWGIVLMYLWTRPGKVECTIAVAIAFLFHVMFIGL
jgi:hypothetical protein